MHDCLKKNKISDCLLVDFEISSESLALKSIKYQILFVYVKLHALSIT